MALEEISNHQLCFLKAYSEALYSGGFRSLGPKDTILEFFKLRSKPKLAAFCPELSFLKSALGPNEFRASCLRKKFQTTNYVFSKHIQKRSIAVVSGL